MDVEEQALHDNVFYDAGDNTLRVDEQVVAELAAQYGTPLNIFSLKRVVNSFRSIRDAFAAVLPSVSIHYSLKANANNTIVKALLKEGAGVDCVSAGEVHRALRCGCPADHVVFAGVGKDASELEFALQRGVGWFNVENELELRLLSDIAQRLGVTNAKAALRVNPDVTADTHPSIATGHGGAKFGLDLDTVVRLLSSAKDFPGVAIEGVHVHIGSQLGDTKQTVEALQKVLAAIAPFTSVKSINMGGGFPARYTGKALPSPRDFAAAVAPLLQNYNVMLEPGRSIVAEAGVIVTKVLYRKDQGGQRLVIVDASMTDNIRPALYSAKHVILPCARVAAEPSDVLPYTLVGPVCESTDVLGRNVPLPTAAATPGTLLTMLTTGAYCTTMACNYNARPLAPQLVVGLDGAVIVSRKRQTFEDLERDDLDW